MKKVKVIIGALLLITAIAAGAYIAFGDFEPEDSSAGIDKTSKELISTVSYSKGQTIPSFITDKLPTEGVLDYFVLSFSDKQGLPVQRLTGDDFMTIKSITVPKLSTAETGDTVSLPVSQNKIMAGEFVAWSGSDADRSRNIAYQNLIMFSANRDVVVGNYFSINGNYDIEYAGQGQYLFYSVENTGEAIDEIDIQKNVSKETVVESLPDTGSSFNPDSPGAITQIDLLFTYTDAALADYGGDVNMLQARAMLSVNQLNTALMLSPFVSIQPVIFNVVGFRNIEYEESLYIEIDHERAYTPNDGYMDDLPTMRYSYGADIAFVVITDRNIDGAGGIATINADADHAYVIVRSEKLGSVSPPALPHEVGHVFGSFHSKPPENNIYYVYGHAYRLAIPGYSTVIQSIVAQNEVGHSYFLAFSDPGLLVNANGINYPFGIENLNYTAFLFASNKHKVAGFSTAPNGGGGYTPPGPVGYLCDVWQVTCNDNHREVEPSCDTQRNFNNTWYNTWPGGGLGRWQHEACIGHLGPNLSICPNVQQDPIKWCVTLDCPNGDTNGDSRCTTADQGANTQDSNNSAFCPYPQSGQGDINIYSGDSTQINFQTYCGTTYKYLVSSNPDISCNPDNVIMSVNPNPAQIGQGVTFSLAGSTEGDTWVEDYWSGGFNCSGSVTPGQTKTCNATANGTYTWTHKWKKCVGSSTNCSNLCAKTSTFVVSNPIPTATSTPSPTPTPQPPTQAPELTLATIGTQVQLKWSYPPVPRAATYKVERCQGTTCTNFTALTTVGHPTTTFTDTVQSTSTVYRYRVRAANGGGNGPYSNLISTQIPWSFTLKPVCSNGNPPSSSTYKTGATYALWPPNPISWQFTPNKTGSHELAVTSYNSNNYLYIYMGDLQGNILPPQGTPPHSAITYGYSFSSQMAKINRNLLPAGHYTLLYTAAQCP